MLPTSAKQGIFKAPCLLVRWLFFEVPKELESAVNDNNEWKIVRYFLILSSELSRVMLGIKSPLEY